MGRLLFVALFVAFLASFVYDLCTLVRIINIFFVCLSIYIYMYVYVSLEFFN